MTAPKPTAPSIEIEDPRTRLTLLLHDYTVALNTHAGNEDRFCCDWSKDQGSGEINRLADESADILADADHALHAEFDRLCSALADATAARALPLKA